MLSLVGVTKLVGRETHIAPTDLELAPGTLNVLLGPTRSGKTTLLRLMAGLERPTAGRVIVDGVDVTGVPVSSRRVAMVYQQFINYPAMTVYENIASPLRVAKAPAAEIDAKVRRAADLLRLTPYLGRMPLSLSGGQQQRTALARAIVKGAGLVLLDEPLANLDYKLREELRAELPRLFAESGAILVYATTEPTEALLLGGSTATLHEGRVTQFGPTLDVFRRPRDLITARLFSDPPLNTLSVVMRGGVISAPGLPALPTPALPDGDYVMAVQPRHLRLAGEGPLMRGRVTVTEITGSESYIHVDLGDASWVVQAAGVQEHALGSEVGVRIDPARLMFFGPDGQVVA